jgi:trimethylamine--corrinoid protein Co-methyltransferase
MYIPPKLNMLSREDCLHIHQASRKILHHTGVQVFHTEGRKLLQEAGAKVEGELVKIPPSLVEWALSSAPEAFNLHRRGSDQVAIQLDGDHVYFGPGSDTLHYLDPRTAVRREFHLVDIIDCVHVCDALPEISFVMSMGVPTDVPADLYYRYQFATMARHSSKPIVVVCNDLADIEAITAMAAAVAGGMDQLKKYPYFLVYSEPSTPLRHSPEATDKLLFCASHSIPITHSPACALLVRSWSPQHGHENHDQRLWLARIPVGARDGG